MEEVGLASEAYLLEADSDPGKIDNEVPAAVGQMFAGHFNRSSVAVLITISISVLFCGVGFEALVPRRILAPLLPPARGSFCPWPSTPAVVVVILPRL